MRVVGSSVNSSWFLWSESGTPGSGGALGNEITFSIFFLKGVTAPSPCRLFLCCGAVKTDRQPDSWSHWSVYFYYVSGCVPAVVQSPLSEALLHGARADGTSDVFSDSMNLDVYGTSQDF